MVDERINDDHNCKMSKRIDKTNDPRKYDHEKHYKAIADDNLYGKDGMVDQVSKLMKEIKETKESPQGFQFKDSGTRESFGQSVRDSSEGKGAYELISPLALKRLAVVLEHGRKKYAARNWEHSMPMGRILQSALRHIWQYIEGQKLSNEYEDHLGHAAFNIFAAIHYDEMVRRGLIDPSIIDLPDYIHKK